ncbi:hypothetical protein ACQKJC_24770 [Priestia koreensis]|uniref:hypothetical protein n=1 Tax=Priestia koreensis TaxID=284581 RepID=UPI003D04EC70
MAKTEIIPFRQFMKGETKINSKVKNSINYHAFSILPISPMAFLDPTAITIGASILIIVLVEKQLNKIGLFDWANKIEAILNLVLPVSAFSFLIYSLSHL